jgi:hypothetical protein
VPPRVQGDVNERNEARARAIIISITPEPAAVPSSPIASAAPRAQARSTSAPRTASSPLRTTFAPPLESGGVDCATADMLASCAKMDANKLRSCLQELQCDR